MRKYRDIEVSVSKRIKPIPHEERRLVHFWEGAKYYFSIDDHKAVPCRLISHSPDDKILTVSVTRYIKGKEFTTELHLYEDEIGDSPEHAIENQMK